MGWVLYYVQQTCRLDVVAKVEKLARLEKSLDRFERYGIFLCLYLLKNFDQHLLFINFKIIEIFWIFFEVFFLDEKFIVVIVNKIHMGKWWLSWRFPLEELIRFCSTLPNDDLILLKAITRLDSSRVIRKIAWTSLWFFLNLLLHLAAVSWDRDGAVLENCLF